MRLFRAWSIIDRFFGQEQVRMDWFVVGRTEPPAPWDMLIQDYDEEDDNSVYDQIMASELLNKDEVKQLTSYLTRKHQLAVNLEEVELPMKSGGLSFGLRLISGATGFYPLAEEDDYPLEFSVLGHYNCEVPDSLKCLSSRELEQGCRFLECLTAHCPEICLNETKAQELLQTVYAETGLKIVAD